MVALFEQEHDQRFQSTGAGHERSHVEPGTSMSGMAVKIRDGGTEGTSLIDRGRTWQQVKIRGRWIHEHRVSYHMAVAVYFIFACLKSVSSAIVHDIRKNLDAKSVFIPRIHIDAQPGEMVHVVAVNLPVGSPVLGVYTFSAVRAGKPPW
jgi:hypothetical protein